MTGIYFHLAQARGDRFWASKSPREPGQVLLPLVVPVHPSAEGGVTSYLQQSPLGLVPFSPYVPALHGCGKWLSLCELCKMFLVNCNSGLPLPQSPALIYNPDKLYFLCESKAGWRIMELEPLTLAVTR